MQASNRMRTLSVGGEDVKVILDSWLEKKLQLIEDHFTNQLRHVSPPIKGEITKGKLKWRGIKSCQRKTIDLRTLYWIEQRGEKVGKSLLVD